MRIPQSPPDVEALLTQLPPERLPTLLGISSPLPGGKYLHWDELRRRTPPQGLSNQEWWLSTWLARHALRQPLALFDKHRQPFFFSLPDPVAQALHYVDRNAGGQIQSSARAPLTEDSHRYLLNSLVEEAITSSQLEGAATTRRVAASMLRSGRKPRDISERMIFNNYRAMEHLRALKQEKLSVELIQELHRLLTEATLDDPADAGRLRQRDDVLVVDLRSNAVLHEPPRWQELPERMQQLCDFANADEHASPFVHPVLRAILLHFMVGYNHPFSDGNGRTARALFYWSMARSGYWLTEFISISHILRLAPTKYVRAYLHTETDHNDTTYFLLHQLDTLRAAITALHDYVDRKSHEQQQMEHMLAQSPALRGRFNHRQLALLNHALRHQNEGYRVDAHQRSHAIVYQTARTDLLNLEALGLLEMSRQGNAYVFYAPADLKARLMALAERR